MRGSAINWAYRHTKVSKNDKEKLRPHPALALSCDGALLLRLWGGILGGRLFRSFLIYLAEEIN